MRNDNKKITAYPEIVAIQRDGVTDTTGWKVSSGNGIVSISDRQFSLGITDAETARVERAVNTLRVKLSPDNDEAMYLTENYGVTSEAFDAMDTFRLNSIATEKGYKALEQASETDYKKVGLSLGNAGSRKAHDIAITTALSLSGRAEFRHLISGLKASGQAGWAQQCQTAQREAKKFIKKYGYTLNDTDKRGSEATSANRNLANFVQRNIMPMLLGEDTPADGRGGSGVKYAVANGAGAFAPLIWDENALTSRTDGTIHAKKRAVNNGRSVRYPSRMITDPQKRVFGTKKRAKGGIVVVDVSGSMDLPSSDLDKIIANAPNATVFAYSHKPRDTKGTPNAFMLVKDGKRVSDDYLRGIGNIGNGVDAPALDYALKIRRGKNEPVIWVCDGQVTDANDKSDDALNKAVAKIVWQNGIIQAPNTEQAIKQLRNIAHAKVHRKFYGRVGREIEIIRRRGRR